MALLSKAFRFRVLNSPAVFSLSSPHIRTIRERITLGALGEPVSAQVLNHHFQRIKPVLQKAVELEDGHLSHFEVQILYANWSFSVYIRHEIPLEHS